ncbi:MAG: GTP pyrophosphokinase [Gemmatimonadales bacterium]
MATLERAIAIAAAAHEGQQDKAGAPYILHPLRVMLRCTTVDARIVAVLHDVVEDSPAENKWTLERLRAEGFSEAVVAAVDGVTNRQGETYMDFVRRAAADPIARIVKRADLEDNLDVTRIATITEKDRARLAKYAEAVRLLDGLP